MESGLVPEVEEEVELLPEEVRPRVYTEANLRIISPLLQMLLPADYMLMRIFRDTIHQNDGIHLSGSASPDVDNNEWQGVLDPVGCRDPHILGYSV